jgi:hypothetical protein
MTAPIRQRVPRPASDERVTVRRSAARHDRAMAVAGVLPAKPRHARCGLIPLPRPSAHDHDDMTVVRLRGELDPSGTADSAGHAVTGTGPPRRGTFSQESR